MDFGKQIRDAREAKGWRQEDLAERLKITQQAVQKWEGQPAPPYRSAYLRPLCDLLGIEYPLADAPPPGAPRFSRARADGPPPRRPLARTMAEQIMADLEAGLPDPLHQYVGAAVFIRGTRYKFHYASKNVLLHALYAAPPGHGDLTIRAWAWRMVLAMHAHNDVPIAGHHYLIVVMPLPGEEAQPAQLSVKFAQECQVVGIECLVARDAAHLATLIQEYESKPTEADILYDQMQRDQDTFDDLV